MIIGAQFFTIRDFCKDTDSLAESLRKVADIGYTTVQISGTCGYDPQWLKAQLDKNGLQCVLTHIPQDRLLDETEQVCRDHDVFDCRCIGLGMYSMNGETEEKTYPAFREKYLPVARKIRDNGHYFMYHNHARELQWFEGKTILRNMAQDFAPDEMGFTLDTYWLQKGGADPAQYIQEFAGRVPCIHLKDHTFDAQMAVVGEGNINFDRVLAAAEAAGTKYLLVEQDDCYGEDPFDCLKRSYENLRAMGLR